MVDVTVLTPSLGYGRFIEDAIVSVLRQEGVETQHVIQDAGSEDGTIEILRRYGDNIEWVSEPDSGQSDGLNKALTKARGNWVAWLNADEFYLPDALRTLVEMGERSGADLVYGDIAWVDERGRMIRLLPQHPFNEKILRLYGCFIPSSGTIFRRSILGDNPWDPEARMMMDWELYLKLASQEASFRYVKFPAAAFRRHGGQVTADPSSNADEYGWMFDRYSIDPRHRRYGPWMHRAYKAGTGAYVRQIKARHLRGKDMRWFDATPNEETFDQLLTRCYGRRRSARAV